MAGILSVLAKYKKNISVDMFTFAFVHILVACLSRPSNHAARALGYTGGRQTYNIRVTGPYTRHTGRTSRGARLVYTGIVFVTVST